MAWLSFKKKENENPLFTKFKKLLPKESKLEIIRSIYYLGGFEYSKSDYEKARTAILDCRLTSFLQSVTYNAHQDNVELYLVDYGFNRNIVTIFDPVELYQREEILDTFPTKEKLELSSAEKIYSKV